MNVPAWLADLTAEIGAQRLDGTMTRQEAITTLRDKIAAQDDQPLTLGILADFAGRALDSWHRAHLHQAPASRNSEVQSELFPDLPARLYIRPGFAKALILCTAHDWDMARRVLENRTENAIKGAREDWAQFDAAYQRVRPLLGGDLTTAEIAEDLRASA
jgi:hypothetical protein